MELNEFKVDETIIEKFKTGIEKGKQLSEYMNSFDFHLPRFDGPHIKYDIIKGVTIDANESLKDANNINYSVNILESFERANSEGIFDFIADSAYQFEPIFAFISPTEFDQKLILLSNSDMWRVYDALLLRYPYSNSTNSTRRETPFFIELKSLIDTRIADASTKFISTEILKQISMLLDKVINMPVL